MSHASATDSFPDFSGLTLDNGRYLLLEILGAGAYGKVYRALDNLSPINKRSHVAIKCLLKPELGSRQHEFQVREFSLHRQVSDHDNVISFHHHFSDESFVYVVLDLCDGGDLFGAITDRMLFRADNDLVKSTFIQLIDALEYCHASGVFHRDLKPENILYSKTGKVLLADFGLASHYRVSQDIGCGSGLYMSPECIGKEVGNGRYSASHNDIWALGVILVNMLSGHNPWNRAVSTDECYNAFLREKDFLLQVLPISESAHRVLLGLFNVNPLCRPSLPALRKQILQVDTFYKTDEEMEATPITVDVVVRKSIEGGKTVREISSEVFSGNSQQGLLYAMPSDIDEDRTSKSIAMPPVASATSSSSESDISDAESSGPITPATHAVQLAVAVPDLDEEQDIGESILSQLNAFPAPPSTKPQARRLFPSNAADNGPPKRTDVFSWAVQILKTISGSISA